MDNQKIVLELTPKEFHALAITYYESTAYNVGKALAMLTYPKQGDAVRSAIETLSKQMDTQLMNYVEHIYLNDPTSAYNTADDLQRKELVNGFCHALTGKDLTA